MRSLANFGVSESQWIELFFCVPVQKFECAYNEELKSNRRVSHKIQFEYAWCLVRSKYTADIQKGIILLEDLFNNHGDSEKRDCLYYLAIGNARIKVRTKKKKFISECATL